MRPPSHVTQLCSRAGLPSRWGFYVVVTCCRHRAWCHHACVQASLFTARARRRWGAARCSGFLLPPTHSSSFLTLCFLCLFVVELRRSFHGWIALDCAARLGEPNARLGTHLKLSAGSCGPSSISEAHTVAAGNGSFACQGEGRKPMLHHPDHDV